MRAAVQCRKQGENRTPSYKRTITHSATQTHRLYLIKKYKDSTVCGYAQSPAASQHVALETYSALVPASAAG